ncbi:MAG: TetR family transcriptional regulator [Pseudomonadota bacterium]|nr:TetR family transcriptional regulator [Pseudomonadota bacterium]
MAKRPDAELRIITATFKLAAVEGWRRVTLSRIAGAAKIEPDDLRAHFSSRRAILDAFAARINQQVIDNATGNGETIRDTLFDLIMCRLDALSPFKHELRAMFPRSPAALRSCDPSIVLFGLCALRRAIKLTLETAGVSSRGLKGLIKIKALELVYLNALRVWLEDDTSTLDTVMVQLDNSLARLESLAETFLVRRRDGKTVKSI